MSFFSKSLRENIDFSISPEDWQQEGDSTEARLSIVRMKSKEREIREKCWYIDLNYMVKQVVNEDNKWIIKDKELRKMRFFGKDPAAAKITFESYITEKKRELNNELIKQQKTQQAQVAVQKVEAAQKVNASVQPPAQTNATEALQGGAREGDDFTLALLHPIETKKISLKKSLQTRKVKNRPKPLNWNQSYQNMFEKAETRLSSALYSSNPLLLRKKEGETLKAVPKVVRSSNNITKRVSGKSYRASTNPLLQRGKRKEKQNEKLVNDQIRTLFN
jgi:hypothetical protein